VSWWMWALASLGGLAGLIAVMAAIGAFLPVAHLATRSARIGRPPIEVFDVLSDPASYPSWRPGLARVELLPEQDGKRVFREHGKQGSMTMVIEEAERPRHLKTRIADRGLPFGGHWIYRIEPDGDGTRLTISEHGEVYNVVFRFMSRFIFGHASTLEQVLKALGKKFGEEARVEEGETLPEVTARTPGAPGRED
jgi:uncharacterized protein YndB with AHSA1/START domain